MSSRSKIITQVSQRYNDHVRGMIDGGCEEADIVALANAFGSGLDQMYVIYEELAKPLNEIQQPAGSADIGKTTAFDPLSGESKQVLGIDDLTLFISKVEDVVNAELDTLRAHINKNTSVRSKTLEFATFVEHVSVWIERSWVDREDNDPSGPAKKIRNESYDLLKERLGQNTYAIQAMLSRYADGDGVINSNKYFKKILGELERIINLTFASSQNLNTEKTTLDIMLKIKGYVDISQEGHEILKKEFQGLILQFMKKQPVQNDQVVQVCERDFDLERQRQESLSLLTAVFHHNSEKIAKMLEKYVEGSLKTNINSKKYFKKVIEEIEYITDICFTSSSRVYKEKTLLDILLRLKQHVDSCNLPFKIFKKTQLTQHLLDFISEQPTVTDKNGSEQLILVHYRQFNLESSKEQSLNILKKRLANNERKISEMLEDFSNGEMVNSDKYFKKIVAELETIIEMCFTTTTLIRRQKTGIDSLLRIKKFFDEATPKSKNGNHEFPKSDFAQGLLQFISQQPIVQKDDGRQEIVIALQRNFEAISVQPPKGKESAAEKTDPLEEMKNQIKKTKRQYQLLLDSGKIKDQRRIASIQLMIRGLNQQMEELVPDDKDVASLEAASTVSTPIKSQNSEKFRTPEKHKFKRPVRVLTSAEKIENGIFEIFNFYARQHLKANVGFEDFDKSTKVIDLGEFSCFCKDFQISLPKAKMTDIFKKMSSDGREMTCEDFKEATLVLAKDQTASKLREHKERLRETKELVEALNIPRSYENKYKNKHYQRKIAAILEEKSVKYRKYIQNELKQKHMLAEQQRGSRRKSQEDILKAGRERKRTTKRSKKASPEAAKDNDRAETSPEVKKKKVEKKDEEVDAAVKSSFSSNGAWNHYQLYFNVTETAEIQKLQEEEYIMREAELQLEKEREQEEANKDGTPTPTDPEELERQQEEDDVIMHSLGTRLAAGSLTRTVGKRKNEAVFKLILTEQIDLSEIVHPLHSDMEKLEIAVEAFEKRTTDQAFKDYMYQEVMSIPDREHRKKIKGFHLAFHTRTKADNKMSNYKFQVQEETAQAILDKNNERKALRLQRQAKLEKMKKDSEVTEREQFRLLHEQLRQQKQKKLLEERRNRGELGRDVLNYVSMKEKKGGHVPTRKELLLMKKEDQEKVVEEMLTQKKLNFNDLQKLNYKQINKVSQKFAEDVFNPRDILDFGNEESESDEEILQKYKLKQKTLGLQRNAKPVNSYSSPVKASKVYLINGSEDSRNRRNFLDNPSQQVAVNDYRTQLYSPMQQPTPRQRGSGIQMEEKQFSTKKSILPSQLEQRKSSVPSSKYGASAQKTIRNQYVSADYDQSKTKSPSQYGSAKHKLVPTPGKRHAKSNLRSDANIQSGYISTDQQKARLQIRARADQLQILENETNREKQKHMDEILQRHEQKMQKGLKTARK